jgi:hypothetical protein
VKTDLEPVIVDSLSAETCIDGLLWGVEFKLGKLCAAARKVLKANFSRACELDAFGRLPVDELERAAKMDSLEVAHDAPT